MKKEASASEIRTNSGGHQTWLIILGWIQAHWGLCHGLGILQYPEDKYDLAQELFVQILRKQTFPKSAFNPARSSWSHYVWLACRSLALNMGARVRVRPKLSELPETWDGEVSDGMGEIDLLSDFSRSELGIELLTRATQNHYGATKALDRAWITKNKQHEKEIARLSIYNE